MSTVAFDTLEFTETLKAAGVPDAQARAEVKAIGMALSQVINNQVATKDDIHGLKEEIIKLDNKIDTAIKELDNKIDTATKGLDNKIDTAIKELDNKIDTATKGLDNKIDSVDTRLTAKIDLLKWMLGFNLGFTMIMFWKLFNL